MQGRQIPIADQLQRSKQHLFCPFILSHLFRLCHSKYMSKGTSPAKPVPKIDAFTQPATHHAEQQSSTFPLPSISCGISHHKEFAVDLKALISEQVLRQH